MIESEKECVLLYHNRTFLLFEERDASVLTTEFVLLLAIECVLLLTVWGGVGEGEGETKRQRRKRRAREGDAALR